MSENMVENQTSNTDLTGNIRHAVIPLPKPQVHAQHPFRNQKNHDSLREYIQQRLYLAMQNRDSELNRLVEVDKNVSGWMRLSREDRERQRQQRKDGIPLAVEINLPLAYVHLDDMMTYFATTFSPNRGMFYQAGKPAEQDSAQQIVTLMNNHAIYAGYFREVLQGVYSLLKYNRGGFHVYWALENGPKISVDPKTQQQQVTSELRWQGNKLEAIDVYNTLYDSSVTPAKLHCDGEFVAMPSSKSYHWLQNKAAQGVYYNCDSALSDWNGTNMYRYYRNPPKQANMEADDSGGTDWKSILMGSEVTGFGAAFEVTPIYIRLNPTEFGLIDGTAAQKAARNRLEIWRFTLLNDKYIIDATYMNNIHGYLPVFMGVLNDDIMSTAQKSAAEILQPLQNFASSLLNTHVQSNRKNLWNLTIYDPSMVDLKEIPQGEVAARIPIKPEAMGRDIRTGLWTPGGELDTQQTMKDLSGVMDIINQFFPTQSMPSQVANIDRAIDSQVAAVQQGANRRQQKSARLLDDTIFRMVRFAMYYNIIQYQPDQDTVMDYYTGAPVQIDIAALRSTDLPFIIGQGIKSLDRMAAAAQLQKVIFALIQAPQAQQGIDLLGLMNYWTDMIDIEVDMNQFKLAPPPQQPGQGQPGQPDPNNPTGPAIVPATSPTALQAPLRHDTGTGQTIP